MPRGSRIANITATAYYSGLIILLLGAIMVVPLVTSILSGEWAAAIDFALSLGICESIGFLLMFFSPRHKKDLTWTQGMFTSSFSWLLGTLVAALPYYLSGHWQSYLDAIFDVMSGFTTTGLTLAQDLDHISNGVNMWRHLLTWLGGQGMVVLALTFFVRSLPGAFKMYVGEAKDERLLPNVIHTARAIWYISIVYLLLGTAVLWIIGVSIGLSPGRGFLHGLWVLMAAWSTGGFAPQSQNILYYHSLAYEIATMLFFIVGSLNFNLHWAVWTGNRRELYRNLEAVTFFITSTILATLVLVELARLGVYPEAAALFRRGYYIIISAHTTTGFMTIYARQFVLEWGPLALFAIIAAMLFGGSASSTAGGFKAVRIGIALKAVAQDVKRLLRPEKAVVIEKFHMVRDIVLEDGHVRPALTIITLYLFLWIVVTLVTAAFGYDLPSAMFEAASVTGNVGLSAGVTVPTMPWLLKVTYILAMWLGRLEFLSVFVLFGYFYNTARGR